MNYMASQSTMPQKSHDENHNNIKFTSCHLSGHEPSILCDGLKRILPKSALSSDASICSRMAFLQFGNADQEVMSVSIGFPSNSKWDALFHRIAYGYCHAGWDGLWDHLRDVPWKDIFKLSASATASEFWEWVQTGIDVYTYPSSEIPGHASIISMVFSCFCLHHTSRINLLNLSKAQTSRNCSKGVLEAAKLAYTNKTKESITSQKLNSRDFWQIANSVLNKSKPAISTLLNGLEVLSSASNKAKLFVKNFSKNSNLDNSAVTLPIFHSNLKIFL